MLADMHYVATTRMSPLGRIRRERQLPRPGDVLVRKGEEVTPTQIVARASMPGDFRIVPIARLLDLPVSEIKDCLQISVGDAVRREDVIAERGGLFGRSVESPLDGVVTAIQAGKALIEAPPVPVELPAHIPGTVLSVTNNQTVVIETVGAVIQGAWGTGGESVGVLKCLTERPHEPLEASAIDASCHGTILVTGTLSSPDLIARADDVEARGIVAGRLAPYLLPAVQNATFPVIVIDGFGDLPMTDAIFSLLTERDGSEASVSARTGTPWDARRPEVIIPTPNARPPEDEDGNVGELTPGATVRIVRAPYLATVGTVRDIPSR